MLVTFDTSHENTFWLNEEACWNIAYMLVTFDTSQEDRSWLNEEAPENSLSILVTFDTCQDDKSCLNMVAFSKIELIFVTSDTSQDPIGSLLQLAPLAEISKHLSTAFLSSALDFSFRTALCWANNICFVMSEW